MRAKGIFLAALLLLPLAGCERGSDTSAKSAEKAANPALGARWQYPRERVGPGGRRFLVHAPQIRSWDNFERFTAQVAIESLDDSAEARYAVVDLSGDTTVDMKTRIVSIPKPKVDRVTLTGTSSEERVARIRAAVEKEPLQVPVDVFLYYLADNVLEGPPPEGFNTDPPPIYVVESPTFLLFFNGDPVMAPIAKSGLEIVLNANFPTVHDPAAKKFYLLTGDRRYLATKAQGPWTPTTDLPLAFAKIPPDGEFASLTKLAATKPASGVAPLVITTFKPAEIVVLDGPPNAEEIPGTGGLAYIANTESPLFKLGDRYFLLIAGRWFSTQSLANGPWAFTMPLPEAFSRIPEDHAMASVRASVPGTLEARRAVLEATIPTRKSVKAGAAPATDVQYAGQAKFEAIPGTKVARAVNTSNDVLKVGDKYYLCYEGVWFESSSPNGPWAATGNVPGEIYEIPPSSPSYAVTQVVAQPQPGTTTVVYEYPPSYTSSFYVGFGIGYYGTGWYYPPYYYGGYYYPYYGYSYGHGSWYNPNTGGYGSRSVWYGPYGGYSYNQGYNPETGRYSNVETAWDGDEWVSSGETFNPRTGISTETDRYYNENSNRMEMDRTVSGPGGGQMDVERTTDFDTGTMNTKRTTDAGGSSDITRQRQAGGGHTSSGTITTAGGKTATIEGSHEGGKGTTTITGEGGGTGTVNRERNQDGSVSREGSFSKGDQTVNTETRRDGTSSITKAEGSGGGTAISGSSGLGERTTIAQSGSGDIYAGHDGNVYKKTDDGWQQYNDGNWQDVETPDRPGDGERPGIGEGDRAGTGDGSFSRENFDAASRDATRDAASGRMSDVSEPRYGGSGSLESRSASSSGTRSASSVQSRSSSSTYSQLNRDASARQGGYNNYQQRSASRSSMRGGGMRSRRR